MTEIIVKNDMHHAMFILCFCAFKQIAIFIGLSLWKSLLDRTMGPSQSADVFRSYAD